MLADEYLAQELSDGVEIIAWIAAQDWCEGNVGMMGKSWGGFNALQVAALRPPALKAIITVCSTDDRYCDDVHYIGGCVLNDNLWWGAIMLAYQARPPDPEIAGPAWRARWLERIAAMPFFPALWLKHPRRDAYWRHGSVCEDFAAIQCPVFAIGGWADAYSNAVPRLLNGLKGPCLGIIGPWAHLYPHDGVPGPAIGFPQEAVRWWDHWLKGRDTGIMKEPMLRAFIEDWTPPGDRDPTPGRWVGRALGRLSSQSILDMRFGAGVIGPGAETVGDASFHSPAFTGAAAGEWMGTGVGSEAPIDQRFDDAFSLTFDSAPLDRRFEWLGAPEVEVTLSSDVPIAQLCVRLCDVAPDGSSRRVSYGLFNLTHRESHAEPKPLTPGAPVTVRLRLNDCGYAFAPGHRLRLAFSTAYWPLVWPAPTPATLTLHGPGLLRFRAWPEVDGAVAFPPPLPGKPTPTTVLKAGSFTREFKHDVTTGVATYTTHGQGGLFGEGVRRFDEIGVSLSHDLKRELTIRGDDPLSARYEIDQAYEMGFAERRIRIETKLEMSADGEAFRVKGVLKAFEDGALAAQRVWDERIARDLV